MVSLSLSANQISVNCKLQDIVVSIETVHDHVVSIKLQISWNHILCHVTCTSQPIKAFKNSKISREILKFQEIFLPFKEQSCFTDLLKIKNRTFIAP